MASCGHRLQHCGTKWPTARLPRKRTYLLDVRRRTTHPMKATLKAAISSEASSPTVIRVYAPHRETLTNYRAKPTVHLISININLATSPTLSLCVILNSEVERRAMPTRTLCPKCHGQRTIACPVCSGSGGRCSAGVIIGICEQCHGSGRCRCDVCGGAAEVEPDTLRGLTAEQHSIR
jgi:hypothetical protein